MFKPKRIFILALLFFAAFFWAGGTTLMPKPDIIPTFVTAAPSNEPTLWDRIYRFIALKNAVEKKIDKRNYVKLQDIPLITQQAIIAVEDNRFYRHFGIDIEGILRAALVNLQAGEFAEGGSTITQQLAKNLFLSQNKTMLRKVEEALLALDFELRYSKEEILEMYLNTIYFGAGAYGINDAARIYFNKTPRELNLAESAMLAGLPSAPSVLSPYVDYNAAKQRQGVVLNAMLRQGYISSSMAHEARQWPLKFAK